MKAWMIGLFLFSSPVFAAVTYEVSSLQLNGNGCPMAEDSVSYHWEGKELVLNFAAMTASKGKGQPLSASRKQCALIINLTVPEGYRYAIQGYRAEGYSDVAAGDQLFFSTSQHLQGDVNLQNNFEKIWRGPRENEFSYTRWIPASDRVWSSCGAERALVVNNAIRVSSSQGNRESESFGSLDSVRLLFRVARCP